MHQPGEKVILKNSVYDCMDDPHMKLYVDSPCEFPVIEAFADEIVINASESKNAVRVAVSYDRIAA